MSIAATQPTTADRIVSAATELLEQPRLWPVTMGVVAEAAGVSRQALYLHFTDRTQLLLHVARKADESARTPARQRRIDAAPTARDALREYVTVQAEIKAGLRGVATALDVLRRSDEAAAAAWAEREHARLDRCRVLAVRLRDDGDLVHGYGVESAGQLIWAVTSQRVWDDLVMDQGWTQRRYRRHLTRLLEVSLTRDADRAARPHD